MMILFHIMDFGMFNSNGVSLLLSSSNIFVENKTEILEAEVIEDFNKTMFSRHIR